MTMSALLARTADALAEDLAGLGHLVDVIRTRAPGSASALDTAVTDVGLATASDPLHHVRPAVGRELAVLRAAAPDVILAVGAHAGRLVEDLMPALRVPWVWTPGAERCVNDSGDALWCPSTATRVLVSSHGDRDALVLRGAPVDACDVVPWHYPAQDFWARPGADEPTTARTMLTAADAGGEGVADLIRACAVLPGVRLDVALDPAAALDDELIHRWLRLARGLGVGERLRLVRVASAEGLATLLPGVGMVVSVPHAAPQKEFLAAAMWCGVPVVASDREDVRELVESGCTGLLLPASDGRRLARALDVVRRDERSRRQWSRAARRRASELFSTAAAARAVSNALEGAAKHGSVGRPTPETGHAGAGFGAVATG